MSYVKKTTMRGGGVKLSLPPAGIGLKTTKYNVYYVKSVSVKHHVIEIHACLIL